MPNFGRQQQNRQSPKEYVSDNNLEGTVGAAAGTALGAGLGYGAGKLRDYFSPDESSWTDFFSEGPSAFVDQRATPEQMATWGGSLGMPIGKELGESWAKNNEETEEAKRSMQQRRRLMRMRQLAAQRQQQQQGGESRTKENSLNTRQKQASFCEGFKQRLHEDGVSVDEFSKYASRSGQDELQNIAHMLREYVQ